ncbi:phosphate-starvation-inducible PsiE family protein [Spirulina subsalsa FACHB-351]|uniref:Phosphate-starvation-inducible PsiE family protein n=1 Tax=Spirulina subsalsa FACHB-351 TaxID=234711 RepID=A0ABT3L877_9CYAN|nr:phosphate-starvation-inducible PsiE family protein [Spirulina subsalsa FACHB-351]
MLYFRRLVKLLTTSKENQNFLTFLHQIESLVSKLLALLMVMVIFFAIYELSIFLFTELFVGFSSPFVSQLFKVFGLFLNILIALEILENITAYLQNNAIQLELVIMTSLIAVARKIIIFDIEKKSSGDLIAMSIAVFLLALSYAIVRSNNRK